MRQQKAEDENEIETAVSTIAVQICYEHEGEGLCLRWWLRRQHKQHGRGIYKWPDGRIYEGDFVHVFKFKSS